MTERGPEAAPTVGEQDAIEFVLELGRPLHALVAQPARRGVGLTTPAFALSGAAPGLAQREREAQVAR
jgi:hypothetical protein